MREAVIVSTARTPIGKAYRGAFNNTDAASLGGHAIREAVKRAGVEPGEIDDVVMGAALQQGATASNIARNCAVAAGLPVSVAGMSVDRQRSEEHTSELQSLMRISYAVFCFPKTKT